jgi:hypothetical protein
VYVYNARGRFRNCVITECGGSGILCYENALVELEGHQTKVERNGTREGGFGLCTYFSSSRIHLLFPLTKESVSTDNGGIMGIMVVLWVVVLKQSILFE